MNELINKLFFQLVQSAAVQTRLQGGQQRGEASPRKAPGGECLSARPLLDNAWPWEVRTLKKVQTQSTCFYTRPTDFLCTLEDFHSLNYEEEKKKRKRKIRSAGIGLWRAVPYILGASWSQGREVLPTLSSPLPPPPTPPIEDRFKAPLYIELQLIASHLCCQSELSHWTISHVIYSRTRWVD